MKKKYSNVYRRHQARRACVQALYEWLVNAQAYQSVLEHVAQGRSRAECDLAYFEKCFVGVCQNVGVIEETVKGALDRNFNLLTPVESAVLHLAVFELKECIDVPYKVVINEAIKLTKEFGAQDGYKYINGVLDKLSLKLRQLEQK